jgi:hypothetical protein
MTSGLTGGGGDGGGGEGGGGEGGGGGHGVVAQVEHVIKIEAKLKAVYHILVSSACFQALSSLV